MAKEINSRHAQIALMDQESNGTTVLLTCDGKLIKDLQTWIAPIYFPVWSYTSCDEWRLEEVNINSKMADYTCGGCKYYFDSKAYPVIDDASWKNLITHDLLKACHASGASFYNAGGSRKGL